MIKQIIKVLAKEGQLESIGSSNWQRGNTKLQERKLSN